MEGASFARQGTLLKRICPVIPTKPEGRRGICLIGSDEGNRDKQIPPFVGMTSTVFLFHSSRATTGARSE